jgi:ParB-like chromosome segregation protein Spo0J
MPSEIEVLKLIPYINNARTHSESQINQIAASIKEFGFRNPILVDGENGIIAGHGRVMAAKKLGLTTIPYIDCSDLTEAQKKAYIIADNKIALNAGWDEELLKLELEDIEVSDIDMELLGFSDEELKRLIGVEDADTEEGEITDDGNRNLLLVEFINESELQKIFEELKERGFECKIMN